MKLYGTRSPNVQKILLALEEFGLDYEYRPVNVWGGEQHEPDFGKLNPNRKVPVLVDPEGPDGEEATLFESGAILIYLADKYGKFLPATGMARYTAIQWLMFQMASIGPMFGQFTHFKTYVPQDRYEYSRNRYQTEVRRLYEVLEKRLSESDWLGGPEYSIVDMATYPWSKRYEINGIDLDGHPTFARWLQAIEARPAAQRYLEKFAAINAADEERRKQVSEESMDRYLLRGRYSRP